jgi:outer membrane protein assembly factor BamB
MSPLVLLLSLLAGDEWTRFRGPNGSGVSATAAKLPVKFGPGRNLSWKTAVPFSRSSPIVAGGRVFVTAAEGENLLTLAFDGATGKQLWRQDLKRPRQAKLYRLSDNASSTPVADDKAVYVFFAEFGLIAYNLADGKERWRQPLGPFQNYYGMGASPVLAGDLLIMLCDQTSGSYLLALDHVTGRQRWKTPRGQHREGWSTPIVSGDEILTFGTSRIDSYSLSTGESRWWMPLSSNGSMGVPLLYRDSLLLAASGSDQPWMPAFASALAKLDQDGDGKLSERESKDERDWFEHFPAVDANHDGLLEQKEWDEMRALGSGDYGAMSISLSGAAKGRRDPATAVRWRVKRSVPYVSSPLILDGVLYMVKDGGIVSSLDPATGAILKQGRAAKGLYFASIVAADGKLFLLSAEGKVTVLKPGAQWEVLQENDLGEECHATPAIAGGTIYIRTRGTLMAFRESVR